ASPPPATATAAPASASPSSAPSPSSTAATPSSAKPAPAAPSSPSPCPAPDRGHDTRSFFCARAAQKKERVSCPRLSFLAALLLVALHVLVVGFGSGRRRVGG